MLFEGGNNVIQVYCKGWKASSIMLKSLDNTLKIAKPDIKGDTISAMAMPYTTGAKKMRLAILDARTKKVLKTLNCYGDVIPTPQAQLGKLTGNQHPRKTLLDQQELKVVFPNSFYCYPYRIKQFVFRMKDPKLELTRPVLGNKIPVDILQAIKDAAPGTYIEFTDIKATCPECVVRTLDNLKIQIR